MNFLHRAHASMARHLGRTLLGGGLVLAALLGAARSLSVDTDVANLLPGGPGSPKEAAQLLSEFGALDTLLIDVSSPGATPDALVEKGEALRERLVESGRFAQVYAGPSTEAMFRLAEVLQPRRLYLVDPAQLDQHLQPAALARSLAQLKERLASPAGFAMKKAFLSDPLGLDGELLGRLSTLGGSAEVYRGHLLSKDKAHLLLVATPKGSALDVDSSQGLLEYLRAVLPPGIVLEAVGGPRFAAESAQLARHDVVFNFVTSGLALLALFLIRFRSVRMFAIAAVPLLFGVAVALAAVALLRGRIHGLTLGFGSALIGIAVDYPMYLLNRALSHQPSAVSRFSVALDDVWGSLWLGWSTTGLCFVALLFSEFPAVRELGIFAGLGITGAFACTLVLLPPLAERLGPSKAVPASWPIKLELEPVASSAVAILVLVASAFASRGLSYDGDLRHLDTQRPATLAAYHAVLERFGQTEANALVVSRGADLEAALELNDAVARALGGSARGISALLPSKKTQEERAAAFEKRDLAADKAHLADEANAAGFKPEAFDGFWKNELPPLSREDLRGTAVEPLIDKAIHCGSSGCGVVTLLAGPVDANALPPGAKLVDADALAAKTLSQIPRQMLLLCAIGLLSNVLLLAFAYRSPVSAALACLPCLLGLLATLGVLALARVPLDLVSASALVLILGCGVDYGIFMLHGLKARGGAHGVDALGVVLTSATTLLGFGTMVFASHRALQSIGLAVSIGIAGSALATLFVMPGIVRRRAT